MKKDSNSNLEAARVLAGVPTSEEMRGPFPIMSTPYLENGERGYKLTEAYAMYRLLIDQRNFPEGLRGYSLYLLQQEGIFKNLVSRQYEDAKVTEGGSFGAGHRWRLDTVTLSERQKGELDQLLKDMMDFVGGER